MGVSERSVLHVLPHPGGGGATYVDLLDHMPGYRFSRVCLAPSSLPSVGVARGIARALREGRSHDLVHAHGEVAACLCLPLLVARPSVVTLNGLHLVRRASGLRREAASLNLRAIVRAAGFTICVSHAERHYLITAIGAAAEHRSIVVHNGVRMSAGDPHARAEVRRELGYADTDVLGIWVGALAQHKDPLTAVNGAERASVLLLAVGDGPLRPEVERAAGSFTRVLGHRGDVPRLLAAADIFVLTSLREGFAFALLEAMSRGLPAIVTDIAENIEAVGDSGVLVPRGDVHALASALSRLAEHSEERAALGRLARQRAGELFDAAQMVSRTRELYEEVLASR